MPGLVSVTWGHCSYRATRVNILIRMYYMYEWTIDQSEHLMPCLRMLFLQSNQIDNFVNQNIIFWMTFLFKIKYFIIIFVFSNVISLNFTLKVIHCNMLNLFYNPIESTIFIIVRPKYINLFARILVIYT